jgi:hypothetical protein
VSFIVLAVIYGGLMTQILNTKLVQSPGFTIMKRSYAQQSQGVNGSTVAELRTNDTAIGETPEMAEKQVNTSSTNLGG